MQAKKHDGLVLIIACLFFTISTIFIASSDETNSNQTIIKVAIIPICNPGRVCHEALPQQLSYAFFKHPRGIARSWARQTNHQTIVKGQVLPWIRAPKKLKSATEVIGQIQNMLEQTRSTIDVTDFDIFIFYINTPGTPQIISWPKGQTISIRNTEISPGFAILINPDLAIKQENHTSHAVVPSMSWLFAFSEILGIKQEQVCLF